VGDEGVRTVCRQANKIRDFCAICVRLNERLYFSDEVFWKQILHKSIINLCFALSSIATEHHLAACPYRTAAYKATTPTSAKKILLYLRGN
jgi:hypothetical protein